VCVCVKLNVRAMRVLHAYYCSVPALANKDFLVLHAYYSSVPALANNFFLVICCFGLVLV